MIPCSSSKIHRWNALDDLDDGISDCVNDDLIASTSDLGYDHDNANDNDNNSEDNEDDSYGDPDLNLPNIDSMMSAASSAASSSDDLDSECNSQIDEDALILAMDDTANTNKNTTTNTRDNQIRNMQRLPVAKSSAQGNTVLLRVKKSAKYGKGHLKDSTNKDTNQLVQMQMKKQSNDTITITKAKDISQYAWNENGNSNVNSNNKSNDIDRMPQELGVDWLAALPTAKSSNNEIVLRVKKSAKYGHLDSTKNDENKSIDSVHTSTIVSVDDNSNIEVVAKPRVATSIHSDGTLRVEHNNSNKAALGVHNGIQGENTNIRPTLATIKSDGTISYKYPERFGMVTVTTSDANEKSAQPVAHATIKSDGSISYRNPENENLAMVPFTSSAPAAANSAQKIATIKSDGSIFVSHLPKTDIVVTDNEQDDGCDDYGDDEDLDDDICDNVDHSRYTRSLHSMPVLEEVTDEDSPLHSLGAKSEVQEDPEGIYRETEATWVELRPSPSQVAIMTPRRTNDKTDGTSKTIIPSWLKFTPMASLRGGKYHSMGEHSATPNKQKQKHSGAFFSEDETTSGSNPKPLLYVETVSTSSQSENGEVVEVEHQDLEEGGYFSNGFRVGKRTTGGRRGGAASSKSCFRKLRRRDIIAATAIVLIGIVVGVSSFLIMHRVFVSDDEQQDRDEQRTEEWMSEPKPWSPSTIGDSNTAASPKPDSSGEALGIELPNDLLGKNDFKDIASDLDFAGANLPPSIPKDTPKPSSRSSSPPLSLTSTPTVSPTVSPTLVPTLVPTSPPVAKATVIPSTPSPVAVMQMPVGNNRMIPVIQDTERISTIIRQARRKIEIMIFDDDDLIGKFLRLVFHDCVGGCDGCVDMTNPENNGLIKPIDALQPIVDEFEPQGLSRTDIWMLASLVASELALPFDNNDLLFPLHWIGRETCESRFANVTDSITGHCGLDFGGNPTECSSTRGPHVDQPHATIGTKSMLDFFNDEFGFSPQQVTAIMGAHSVGKMARQNVGFQGEWDLTVSTLDGGYWLELVGNPPDFFVEVIDNSDLPNIPNQHQWRGIIKNMTHRTVAMLNIDVALVRNIEDMDSNGNVGCAGRGILLKECPSDTPFLPFATQYNSDTRKFLMDFREVLNLLIDHGNTKPTPKTLCPEGRVCTFGGHQTSMGVDFAIEEMSPPPTPSPSRAPPRSFPFVREGEPRIMLDRMCYDNIGDTIVVTYDFVSGTDITIQIYPLDDVETIEEPGSGETDIRINPLVVNSPIKSSLSCGASSCHTWTSRGGLQISTENMTGQGNDYAVILLANVNGLDNGLEVLAGDSFRLEGCRM